VKIPSKIKARCHIYPFRGDPRPYEASHGRSYERGGCV